MQDSWCESKTKSEQVRLVLSVLSVFCWKHRVVGEWFANVIPFHLTSESRKGRKGELRGGVKEVFITSTLSAT